MYFGNSELIAQLSDKYDIAKVTMINFSIIICAFNARGRLRETLEHLCLLDYPPEALEIILVDNNSTDSTSEYAKNIWKEFDSNIQLRIISESNQGLNYARKCGINEAKFDYIVFCDDDNWLNSNYLIIANNILTQNSCIGVLGGQGIPLSDAVQFPNWFYTFSSCYAVGVQGVKCGDVSDRGYVWGAGSIVRRDILFKAFSAGHELILSGRKSGAMGAGDDCEMCKWYLVTGYKLWYEDKLTYFHFIPKERLTLEYLEKLLKGLSDSRNVLAYYDEYIKQQFMRRTWYEKPFSWIVFEVKFFLDRRPEKIKVVELANCIKKLFMP